MASGVVMAGRAKTSSILPGEGKEQRVGGEKSLMGLKLIVFGSKDVSGKGLYVKFYHGFRKFRTSRATQRRNPFWNEHFTLEHVQGRPTRVVLELWGSRGWLGNELVSCQALDLAPLLGGKEFVLDAQPTLGGGQVRVKVINLALLPKWERTIAAVAAIEAAGIPDPNGELAASLDCLKQLFPWIGYDTLLAVLQREGGNRQRAAAYLRKLREEDLYKETRLALKKATATMPDLADPGLGCFGVRALAGETHESFLERLRAAKRAGLQEMLPEADPDHLAAVLARHGDSVVDAADELVRHYRHKEVDTKARGLGYEQLHTPAETGGFVRVTRKVTTKRQTGQVLHSSQKPQEANTIGKETFEQRKTLFQEQLYKMPKGAI